MLAFKVQNILGDCDVRVELPHQPRILLASVTKELGRQGVTKGDVVTHMIQGQNLSGKTQTDTRELLAHINHNNDGKLCLVLNAERSVAEALKHQAMALGHGRRGTKIM